MKYLKPFNESHEKSWEEIKYIFDNIKDDGYKVVISESPEYEGHISVIVYNADDTVPFSSVSAFNEKTRPYGLYDDEKFKTVIKDLYSRLENFYEISARVRNYHSSYTRKGNHYKLIVHTSYINDQEDFTVLDKLGKIICVEFIYEE